MKTKIKHKRTQKISKKKPTPKSAPSVHEKLSGFKFEPVQHQTYREMVQIVKTPSWARDVLGKRFINESAAVKMISSLSAEKVIKTGVITAKKEVVETMGELMEETEFVASTKSDYDTPE